MGKKFVIGDIHGCLRPLEILLGKISPLAASDTLIFMGDYIDRGPESRGVLATLISLKKDHRVIALRGNHEEAFLDFLRGRKTEFFLQIGGRETLESYGVKDFTPEAARNSIPADHLQFLANLLPFWEDDEYIYVHAGLQPGVHLSQQPAEWLFWADRESITRQDYNFGKKVIFGHIPNPAPLITANRIGIDCGAVYGGKLACLVLPDLDFISVDSERYWPAGE